MDPVLLAQGLIVDFGATEIESSKLMKALHTAGVNAMVISSEGGPDNPLARLARLDVALQAGLAQMESSSDVHARAKTNGHHHGPPPG